MFSGLCTIKYLATSAAKRPADCRPEYEILLLFSCSYSCLFPPTSALPRRSCLFHDVQKVYGTGPRNNCSESPAAPPLLSGVRVRNDFMGGAPWQLHLLGGMHNSGGPLFFLLLLWVNDSIMKKLVGIISFMEMPKQRHKKGIMGKTRFFCFLSGSCS